MEAHAVVVVDSKGGVTLEGIEAGQKFRVEREAGGYHWNQSNATTPLSDIEREP